MGHRSPVGTQLRCRTQSDHSDPFEPTEDRICWGLTGDTLGGGDGEIKIGGTELDAPGEREIARQVRMKREG